MNNSSKNIIEESIKEWNRKNKDIKWIPELVGHIDRYRKTVVKFFV